MASWTCTENIAIDAACKDLSGQMERHVASSMVMAGWISRSDSAKRNSFRAPL